MVGVSSSFLRRADAIETGGIIRPLRIAEITRVAGGSVGCYRRPDGIGQVRTGFNHHQLTAGPVDVEAKSVRLHTEVAVAKLNLWQP